MGGGRLRLWGQQASWDVPRGEGAALRAGRLGQGLCVGWISPIPSKHGARILAAGRSSARRGWWRLEAPLDRGRFERPATLRVAEASTKSSRSEERRVGKECRSR